MAELIFTLICLAAVFGLAMNRADLKAWAAAVALFTLNFGTGKATRQVNVFNFTGQFRADVRVCGVEVPQI